MIIAVDGLAGAGKGTVATYLADHFRLAYLDTGLLYRLLAYQVLDQSISPHDQAAIVATAHALPLTPPAAILEALRTEAVANLASQLAAIPAVRAPLTQRQRAFIAAVRPPYQGAILDGRDIGTVVCPEADVKLFITAQPEVRLQRRALELQETAAAPDEAQLLHTRDQRDQQRTLAPLQAAADALILDTSDLGIAEACAQALALVERKLAQKT